MASLLFLLLYTHRSDLNPIISTIGVLLSPLGSCSRTAFLCEIFRVLLEHDCRVSVPRAEVDESDEEKKHGVPFE